MSGPRRRRPGSLAVPLALLLVVGGFLLALLGAHVNPPADTARTAPPATVAVPTAVRTHAPPEGPGPANGSSSRARHEVGGLVLGLYLAVLVGGLLALVVLALRALAERARHARTGRDEREPRGHDLQPGLVAQHMAEAAAASLDELTAEGPAADAIIACWQRLRAAAAEAGVPPVPSDTPQEAIARVLRAGAVAQAAARPLATLAGLYREARFSEHDMTRGDVWVARQALQTIAAQLQPDGRDALA